jgi:hypothetical protein
MAVTFPFLSLCRFLDASEAAAHIIVHDHRTTHNNHTTLTPIDLDVQEKRDIHDADAMQD